MTTAWRRATAPRRATGRATPYTAVYATAGTSATTATYTPATPSSWKLGVRFFFLLNEMVVTQWQWLLSFLRSDHDLIKLRLLIFVVGIPVGGFLKISAN